MGFYWSHEFNICSEDEFSITFETNDIIAFSSFQEGINILKKYKIDL